MSDEQVAEIARGLPAAHRRLVQRLGSRWIIGTGIVHVSVGTDLIAAGIAEKRVRHGVREIRALPLGLRVRALLLSEHPHAD